MKYFLRNKEVNTSLPVDSGFYQGFGGIFKASKRRPKAKLKSVFLAIIAGALLSNTALADVEVAMYKLTETGQGAQIGKVTLSESEYGVVFTPKLTNLSAGMHGFHVHQNASCEPKEDDGKIVAGGAAGGHLDGKSTYQHGAPWGDGHLGDLPALFVNSDGTANTAVLAPRLTLTMLDKRAVVIHAGGDNYADEPKPLGGGGERIACGLIETN